MNDERIEQLLRHAPRPAAPPTLKANLEAKIHLPQTAVHLADQPDWRSLLRRWLPALSFATIFLACLIAIAVQSNLLSDLRQDNQRLQAATQSLEQLREENAELQRLSAASEDLEQLRKDNEELLRLRGEVTQLRAQVQELATLRAENQRLLAERQASAGQAVSVVGTEEDPFAGQKEAESMKCVNNLKQIGLAAKIWAVDHNNDLLGSDFLAMTNELSTPKVLICPSDKPRAPFASLTWANFTAEHISYVMLSPGASETHPQVVYARCPIHGHVGLADGSVQPGSLLQERGLKVIQKDGEWVLGK